MFSGRNPRVKKVLIREYNRYELTTIRLDEGRFLRPLTDPERVEVKLAGRTLLCSQSARQAHLRLVTTQVPLS